MREKNGVPARVDRGRAIVAIVGVLVVIGVILLAAIMWAVGVNNQIVKLDQAADQAWAQVQSQYQRRLDLIPNLVNTVKGAAQQEVAVVVGAVRERAKATQMTIDPKDAAQFQKFAQQQASLGGALSRLLVTVERYPQIKTDQNFLELQSQIEGTENRISVERKKFNESVQNYNVAVLSFPGSLIAGFRNFHKRPFFQGTAEAQQAPKVDFGTGSSDAASAPPAATTAAPAPASAGSASAGASPSPGVPPPPPLKTNDTSSSALPEG